ncbi:MAG: hypothetical protein K0S76_598 [Herbinix sp.]|jgi:glycosyltransferase involved in cell wall biosynthesis|nr:hypothetical protein [Herbinix sp.]
MQKKKRIVLVDFETGNKWKFADTLKKTTKKEWKVIKCISNNDRIGFFANMKRYVKYFMFTLKIFLTRKSYSDIIAWQQFYGLIFAFYCRLFHCKKTNKLMIMTFIYKAKPGVLGKIYHRFMTYIIKSRYIDKIVCFSSHECSYYAALFGLKDDKFVFVHFGEELPEPSLSEETQIPEEKDFILSVGFSYRDYDFLIDTMKDTDYHVKIYGDKTLNLNGNIQMSSERLGNKTWDMLSRCRCLVIPLKDSNIAAGQLTILHAMQIGKPVIVTDSKGICDYITHGETGFIAPNNKRIWLDYINQIYNNEELYHSMCHNAKDRYSSYHTIEAMGKTIGKLVLSI